MTNHPNRGKQRSTASREGRQALSGSPDAAAAPPQIAGFWCGLTHGRTGWRVIPPNPPPESLPLGERRRWSRGYTAGWRLGVAQRDAAEKAAAALQGTRPVPEPDDDYTGPRFTYAIAAAADLPERQITLPLVGLIAGSRRPLPGFPHGTVDYDHELSVAEATTGRGYLYLVKRSV